MCGRNQLTSDVLYNSLPPSIFILFFSLSSLPPSLSLPFFILLSPSPFPLFPIYVSPPLLPGILFFLFLLPSLFTPQAPSGPPSNVEVELAGNNMVRVRWSSVPGVKGHAIFYGYQSDNGESEDVELVEGEGVEEYFLRLPPKSTQFLISVAGYIDLPSNRSEPARITVQGVCVFLCERERVSE